MKERGIVHVWALPECRPGVDEAYCGTAGARDALVIYHLRAFPVSAEHDVWACGSCGETNAEERA